MSRPDKNGAPVRGVTASLHQAGEVDAMDRVQV
jgi:hypothetical protein